MNIKQAPIDIKKFWVDSVSFDIVPLPPDNKKQQLPPIPLEIDFNVLADPRNKKQIRIIVHIAGNREKKAAGYSFRIVAEGLFEFSQNVPQDEAELDEALNLALPILIHSVRSYLLTITAMAPYGPFPLPMPDTRDILEQKRLAALARKAPESKA